ncbi:MAG TPA: hypothetical protein VK031_10345 [Tissierellaceae bacterium]|nr:hypothetical protein [Tissierellaceae bacterium]
MDFRNKKIWIIGIVILALIFGLFYQNMRIKRYDRILRAYDHNSINTYKYLMAKTNFKSSIERLEDLYELDEIDDEMLIEISDIFGKITDHLMHLNVLRGYSIQDDMLKENESRITDYSYILLYKEQSESDEIINKIYLGFEELLMDMYQTGIEEDHKKTIEELTANLRQIEGLMKSSVNRHIDPNDLGELREEYVRIEPMLNTIVEILDKN